MPRSAHWINSRSTLAVLLLAFVVLSFLPPRYVAWVSWLSERPVTLVMAPLQKTMGGLVAWFVRRPQPHEDAGPAEALAQKVRELETDLLRQRAENERLRARITEYERGRSEIPESTRQLFAPIIGGGADSAAGPLKAKVGSADGVEEGAVAVLRGVNLVGRVVRVAPRYCFIQPITARAAPRIEGVVILDNNSGPGCSLEPTGDGALRGPVMYAEGHSDPAGLKGQLVRLSDDTWPAIAQMLVLGRVESVTDSNLRQIITVRPVIPLDRVPEVVLRMPAPKGDGAP